MENTNNGSLISVIVVLLVALIGVCAYVAYDKGIIFNNQKQNSQINNDVVDNNKVDNAEIECECPESLRIDGEEVSNITKLINGHNVYSEGNNLLLTNEEVAYDEIIDKYNFLVISETSGPQVKIHVVNAIKQDNKYTITLKAIFPASYDSLENIYYADYNRTVPLNNLYYDMNMGGNPTNTLDNISKGTTYELVFTKNTDSYKFETSKPLND